MSDSTLIFYANKKARCGCKVLQNNTELLMVGLCDEHQLGEVVRTVIERIADNRALEREYPE